MLLQREGVNRRVWRLSLIALCVGFFLTLWLSSMLIGDAGLATNLPLRKLPPSFSHWLGTDWLGRDMLTRTIKGLWGSLQIGLLAATVSSVISLLLGIISATAGRAIDAIINSAVDAVMSMPHLVLLILISFALGGDRQGVILAVAFTHWPRLARIIRAETLQLQQAEYVQISQRFGRSAGWIALNHYLPHLWPQFIVGLILLFPHAILHAAGLTFLGFGMSPNQPCIGVLLSESMRHISTGYWWLAIFPGLGLLITVKIFDILASALQAILSAKTAQE